MKTYAVFDIDGTIADCNHRLSHAQMKEWDTFHSKAAEDAVVKDIADLMIHAASFYDIILLTGRNERYRKLTEEWLDSTNLNYYVHKILMRPDDDWSHDYEMKITLLEKELGSKEAVLQKVAFVIDDRDSVVEGLRNYGLTVLQCSQGGY